MFNYENYRGGFSSVMKLVSDLCVAKQEVTSKVQLFDFLFQSELFPGWISRIPLVVAGIGQALPLWGTCPGSRDLLWFG